MSGSEPASGGAAAPTKWALWGAFLAVYLIWGSTYLAIRFVVVELPPFLTAGIRHLIVGAILFGALRLSGTPWPDRRTWIVSAVVGTLLLFGGNGLVQVAEQTVPSGLTALVIAVIPIEIVLLAWLWPGGGGTARPRKTVFAGLALGAIGLGILVGPSAFLGEGRVPVLGALLLLLATASWAIGSVYAKRKNLTDSPFMMAAIQSLAGGVVCLVVGTAFGEWPRMTVVPSPKAMLAFGYLVVFGSLIAYSCYIWLLKVASPARVATYAYVNPVVAVVLGWAFAGEPLTWRTILAAAVIIGAVAMVASERKTASPPSTSAADPS